MRSALGGNTRSSGGRCCVRGWANAPESVANTTSAVKSPFTCLKYNVGAMSRKSVGNKKGCALCGAKEVSEPRGEERYCRDCWDKKIAVEEIVAREFVLKRYIRAHSAEKYLIYHSTQKRPCGQLIVVDDGYDLFLSMMIYPNFAWDEPAYHLEGDPEGRTFAELLVDVVATEVIEPWGGGKWHLEVFRSTAAEPEDWNGEM